VLLEMYTYRMGAHTTSDDPSIYRTKEEEESWKHKDPLLRMRAYLDSRGLWDDTREAELREAVGRECDAAMAEVEAMPRTAIDEIFSYHYETMPPELERQMTEYKQFLAWKEAR
jgi:pyruvate dehydrogenase E1 component alpha subunit